VVLFNRGQDDARLSEVTSDNVAGARKIADFLTTGGHRRIAHISGWLGSSTGRDRAAGFRQGLANAGMAVSHQIDGLYKREAAAAAAREMCSGADRPDAVFVGNDHMAFAVMDTLRQDLGLSVPGEVSVVGYDDVPMAAWPAYDLTTLRQPSNKMVSATVSALMARIIDPDAEPRKIRIDGPLILRGSARVPEGWT
jgi:DNA-binding LacI/PurR family transcriptional regulator